MKLWDGRRCGGEMHVVRAIVLTLMRLHVGVHKVDLLIRYGLSQSSISHTVNTWISPWFPTNCTNFISLICTAYFKVDYLLHTCRYHGKTLATNSP